MSFPIYLNGTKLNAMEVRAFFLVFAFHFIANLMLQTPRYPTCKQRCLGSCAGIFLITSGSYKSPRLNSTYVQLTFTFSKSTIETLEKVLRYVQS